MSVRPQSLPIVETGAPARVHLLEALDLRLPFWRYHAALREQPYGVMLDSAKDPERLGQYSFIAADPFLVYRVKRLPGRPPVHGARIEMLHRHGPDGRPRRRPLVTRTVADPFETLRRLLEEHAVERAEYHAHPVPFLSGAVGYIGYEAGYFIEPLPDLGADDLRLPDIYLLFVDALLAHCHRTGRTYLSVLGRGPSDAAARERAVRVRDEWRRRIDAFEANPEPEWTGPSPERARYLPVDVRAHFDEAAYARAVQAVKRHIMAGDAYEVCLTHRLESPLEGDPWDLYRELRRINPAPFAAFLDLPEVKVVSSSPERFLRLGPDRVAESRPIKGTRPRGTTPEQDEALYRELLGSVKDRAENVMIVDLVRNDLGRVSKFGSVRVTELMAIERYATVFQMVSTIRGELEDGLTGVDLIRACFPGGSMTGAPKIEAMKIIDRLEPVKRGIYSGSIGYLDFAGPLDLNIVIRTLVATKSRCYYNVGGAVVADSDPHAEYAETMDKARALMDALRNLKACAG